VKGYYGLKWLCSQIQSENGSDIGVTPMEILGIKEIFCFPDEKTSALISNFLKNSIGVTPIRFRSGYSMGVYMCNTLPKQQST
jgi:hypothetical protein